VLVGRKRKETNGSHSALVAVIALAAVILMPVAVVAQGHSGGGGGGGPGGPGGGASGGSHTSGDDGHSGKKGGDDSTRGKGRAPSSLSDVFRDMEDEAASDAQPGGKKGTPEGKGPSVTSGGGKKGPPEGKGSSAAKAKGPSSTDEKTSDEVVGEDDDSDRPVWAGGNPELNPHSGGGGGKPEGAGSKKGDLYGDLIMLKRDPETGVAVQVDGEYLICLNVACTETTPTVGLEVPEGVTAIEVEFGRSSVARAPDKVTEKALTDALAKLTADGVILDTDTSGRITYTVDGETSTIDSPLENLALYVDLLKGLASATDATATETALGDLATLDTAAALFAGVADKTGDITIDYVYYQNLIAGTADTYYDYSGFDYTRDYPTDYSYWVSIDGADPVSRTLDINAYLDVVNGTLPDGSAALFAAAADDSLEVIELVHTQIYTEVLPGTTD